MCADPRDIEIVKRVCSAQLVKPLEKRTRGKHRQQCRLSYPNITNDIYARKLSPDHIRDS